MKVQDVESASHLGEIEMSAKLQARTYSCPACGWSKTVAPHSDAFAPGDVYQSCPVCGFKDLQQKAAGFADAGLADVREQFRKLFA